jgi:hypothetical protein
VVLLLVLWKAWAATTTMQMTVCTMRTTAITTAVVDAPMISRGALRRREGSGEWGARTGERVSRDVEVHG